MKNDTEKYKELGNSHPAFHHPELTIANFWSYFFRYIFFDIRTNMLQIMLKLVLPEPFVVQQKLTQLCKSTILQFLKS